MGFGNAAGSFMTGFMAGYKFIDDAEKRKAEIEALNKKGEIELVNEKNKFIEGQNKLTRELELDFDKLDKDMNEEIKDISDPNIIISIRNNYDNKKAIRTSTYNDTIRAQADSVAKTPLLQFARPVIGYNSSKLFEVKAEDGTSFVVSDSSDFGKKLQEDLKNPVDTRQFIIDKNGYVSTINANGDKVNIDIYGNTAKDDTSAVRLTNINQLITKKPEATNAYSLYPPANVTPRLKDILIKAGYYPDDNGNFPNLTWGTVEAVEKASVNTSLFEPKPMYSKDGKTIISVANKDEYKKALAEGYSPTKPEKMTIPDLKLQQYFKSDAFQKGLTYDYWESEETEKGKTSNVVTAIGASEVLKGGGVVKDAAALERRAIPSMTTEEKKQISDFKTKTNSFKTMEQQLNSLDKLIESGAYKKDIIQTFLTDLGKTAPESMMNVFGSKEALIKTYKMDAQLAGIVFDIIKADSGLTVTDAERKARMETIFGGISSNTTTRRETFQSFLKRTSDQLNLEADTIAGFGGVDTAQQWINYYKMISKKTSMQSKYDNNSGTKQNTPDFKTPAAAAAFKQYGFNPFKIGNITYIVDKFSLDIKKVGTK